MEQQSLFQTETKPTTKKSIEDTIFERALNKAAGKIEAVDGAVRAVLKQGYTEFAVLDKGRWGYLYRITVKRLRRTIRDSERCRKTPLRSSRTRVRA